MTADLPHVLILGGGFAGLYAAKRLSDAPVRVTVVDRTNVRALDAELVGGPVELTVADLSFIALRLVLPALARLTRTDGDLVLLVKPQFEAGREAVGRRGAHAAGRRGVPGPDRGGLLRRGPGRAGGRRGAHGRANQKRTTRCDDRCRSHRRISY